MRPHEDGNYSLDEQHPPLPADVIELVIAARIVAFEDQSAEAIKRLDTASEAFADRVKWDDEDRRARSALAGDGETSDLEQRLRDGAQAIDNDGTSSQVGPSADELREAATLISQLRNRLSDLEGLLPTAKLLYQNSLGCAELHHGWDLANGTPGWLADCEKSIKAASPSPPIPAVEIDGEKENT